MPEKTQVLLIMAMEKAKREGGRLLCVLRSNQAGAESALVPGKAYASEEFLKLISTSHAEMSETK